MMPQPGGANSYLPYPASGSNFPPYPTSNFGGFPSYPSGSSSSNPPSSGGYPPYMPQTPMPNAGYNNFYGGVSINFFQVLSNFSQIAVLMKHYFNFSANKHITRWYNDNN